MSVESEVRRAMRNGCDIEIKYEKYGGEISRRRVSNIEESDEFGNGYISGYCHLRNEDRTFKIERILAVRVLPSGTWVSKYESGNNVSYRSSGSRSALGSSISTPSRTNTTSGYSGSSSSSSSYQPSSYKPSSSYSSSSSSGGCYIATMAYGSYDHPQVMVLRWYRDNILQKSWYGRLFVKVYYYLSPKAVRLLGGHERINSAIRSLLDGQVEWVRGRMGGLSDMK